MSFIPFENLFITFNSPEKVFNYYIGDKSDVNLVVNGKNSDLVIGKNNDANVYLIVPKNDDGWKIGVGIDTKRIMQKTYNRIVIYVYQYKNTNDYFVTILDTNGGYSEIVDSCNSKFFLLENASDSLGKVFVTYFANVSQYSQEYWINVNGEKIVFSN